MKHRNDNMLLRIAQADAYCMAAEYCERHPDEPEYAELREFKRYLAHPIHVQVRPGMYTDDTQMSIAVAETLLYAKQYELDPEGDRDWDDDLSAETFVARFHIAFMRDSRYGYSKKFQELLESTRNPDELRLRLRPDSNKNGAAMRSVPIGVIKDPKEIVRIAGLQASTTHATYGGINSSVAVALMSHFALHDHRPFSSMLGWGIQHCPTFELFREPWVGPVDGSNDPRKLGTGLLTAHAVHTLLVEQTSLMGILKQVIEWGGDTDTVGAIAWGIASARYQDEAIPEFMENELEVRGNLKYGPEYLKTLGKNLMDAYSPVQGVH